MIGASFLVALGGSLGATLRYLVVILAQNTLGLRFPYGTLIVNASGSFLAGFFLTILVGRFSGEEHWRLFFFTGFLGGFTTFSSFAAESFFMFKNEQWLKLFTNILANNISSLAMVFIGAFFARNLISGYLFTKF